MLTSAGPRPARVSLALNMLWIVLALGMFRLWRNWPAITAAVSPASFLSAVAFVIGVLAALVVLMGMRKSWARIVYLLLFLVGLPNSLKATTGALDRDAMAWAAAVGQLLLQLIALVLLFLPESNAWFRNRETGS